MATERKRRVFSIKEELLIKSREAMLSAVQTFNNPGILFKSETFTVLAIIAWTYLMHAYYRDNGIEYRHYESKNKRRRFKKTAKGAFLYWELERCLNDKKCPIEKTVVENLKFLIGLRHEIEHQMTTRIDEYLSARFQACCINYNQAIKSMFGEKYSIENHLSVSLQFSTIKEEHAAQLRQFTDLPANISSFINDFDEHLTAEEYNDIKYAFRVLYVPKAANHKGQADEVIEFIPANSPEAKNINTARVLIKEREKMKYLPGQIVKLMKDKGFKGFTMSDHTYLWTSKKAKNPANGFGTLVADKWYWYESWVKEVEQYCQSNFRQYNKI